MKKALLLLAFAAFVGCTNKKDFIKGKQQLENMGYTDVKSTGYKSLCCSDDDTYSTGFTCKDKEGRTVEGCICSGAGKGITIRFE